MSFIYTRGFLYRTAPFFILSFANAFSSLCSSGYTTQYMQNCHLTLEYLVFPLFSLSHIHMHCFTLWQRTRLFSDPSVSFVASHFLPCLWQPANFPKSSYKSRYLQIPCNQLSYLRCSRFFLSMTFPALTCGYIFIQRYLYAMPKQLFYLLIYGKHIFLDVIYLLYQPLLWYVSFKLGWLLFFWTLSVILPHLCDFLCPTSFS